MISMRGGLNADLIRHMGLNTPERNALSAMARIPLGSIKECALILGKSPTNLYQPIRNLVEARVDSRDAAGLLESHVMGATKQRVDRYWVSKPRRTLTAPPYQPWHDEFLRSRLLARLPLLENFYPVLAELQDDLGGLLDARPSQSQSHDMIARYEKGWAALIHSGVLETTKHLEARFASFHEEMSDVVTLSHYPRYDGRIIAPELVEHTQVNRPRAWPSMVIIVVPDLWQVELVRRAVRTSLGRMPVQIRCIATGHTFGDTTPGPSQDDVYQPVRPGDMGGWPWQNRLQSSLWADNNVPKALDLLMLGFQWPGLTPAFALALLGLAEKSQEAQRSLVALHKKELMKSEGNGRSLRYWMSNAGMDVLCKLDGIGFGDFHEGVRNLHENKSLSDHDAGLMKSIRGFAAQGAHVAPGYREYDQWREGSIVPDAMVYVSESPYGAGWAYKEHEMSGRGRYRAMQKLENYASKRRRNRWPLLVTLWNDEAEKIFHRVGAEGGVPMMTTTVERLRSGMPIQDCWSMYGLPVRLGFGSVQVDGLVNLDR